MDDLEGHAAALFQKQHLHGLPFERIIACTRIYEAVTAQEAAAPTPPAKARVMIVSQRTNDGTILVHKGRQNKDKSIQIGRSWVLSELTQLNGIPSGHRDALCATFRKSYYWVFSDESSRNDFCAVLTRCYRDYLGKSLAVVNIWHEVPRARERTSERDREHSAHQQDTVEESTHNESDWESAKESMRDDDLESQSEPRANKTLQPSVEFTAQEPQGSLTHSPVSKKTSHHTRDLSDSIPPLNPLNQRRRSVTETPGSTTSGPSEVSPIKLPAHHGRYPSVSDVLEEDASEDPLVSAAKEFQWNGEDVDQLEAQIGDKLVVLGQSNVEDVVTLDQRLDELVSLVDESIAECDRMDQQLASYAVQLTGASNEVTYLEGQSDGLQVMATNRKLLYETVEQFLQEADVTSNSLSIIKEAPMTDTSKLRSALLSLYRAIKARPTEQWIRVAEQFSERLRRFLIKQYPRQTDDNDFARYDALVIPRVYNLAGFVLFAKQTGRVYTSIQHEYGRVAGEYYNAHFQTYFAKWKQVLKSVAGGRPPPLHPPAPNGLSLSHGNLKLTYQHLKDLAKKIELHVASQQQFYIWFLHMSTFAAKSFTKYSDDIPDPTLPPKFHRVESSATESQAITNLHHEVFGALEDSHLASLVRTISETVPLESVFLGALLEQRLNKLRGTDQEFLVAVFRTLHARLLSQWSDFASSQAQGILGGQGTIKKRVGVLLVVKRFTELVKMVEHAFSESDGGQGAPQMRSLVDKSMEQLFRAIFQGFSSQSRPAAVSAVADESKSQLNSHVVLVENMHHIVSQLDGFDASSSAKVVFDARKVYKEELEAYISDVLQRPLGRMLEFLRQQDLQKGSTLKPKHMVEKLKKLVATYDLKELRRGVEALRKRVEKHFEDNNVLFDKVWHAIQAEYLSIHSRLVRFAQEYHAENIIEVSRKDIQQLLK